MYTYDFPLRIANAPFREEKISLQIILKSFLSTVNIVTARKYLLYKPEY